MGYYMDGMRAACNGDDNGTRSVVSYYSSVAWILRSLNKWRETHDSLMLHRTEPSLKDLVPAIRINGRGSIKVAPCGPSCFRAIGLEERHRLNRTPERDA